MSVLQQTPFYQNHEENGGKMVDFSGWNLPIHYGSQIKEHDAVRNSAGMFDVSHMMVVDVEGLDAKGWLQKLLANDVVKLKSVGKALYSAMLNTTGGVIDDLIVYRMNEAETQYRIVSNAATRVKDLAQFREVGQGFQVDMKVRDDLAMLAIQGPRAIEKLLIVKPEWADIVHGLSLFQGAYAADEWFVAKTGYTGEEGVEVILREEEAFSFFQELCSVGVTPCGLGARDTLRLEAGMNLYGQDMDENTSPFEVGMAWTIAMKDERDFIGRAALEQQKATGIRMKQVGLLLTGRAVLREGMAVVVPNVGEGVVTSGTFSPTLKQSIAIARVPQAAENVVQVDIRGTLHPARVLPLPFVRNGKKQFD